MIESVEGGREAKPLIFWNLTPKIDLKKQTRKMVLEVSSRLYTYNTELEYYESLIEDFKGSSDFYTKQENVFATDLKIEKFLINFKPSIIASLLDTISLFSSNQTKLSVEKNSILRIENQTGLELTYTLLSTKKSSSKLKGYETKELNLLVLPTSTTTPSTNPNKEGKGGLETPLEIQDISSCPAQKFCERQDKLIQSLKLSDAPSNEEDEEDTFLLEGAGTHPTEINRKTKKKGFGIFTQKKIKLQFGRIGLNYIIDLQKFSDHCLKVSNSHSILIIMKVEGAKTVL